MVVFLSSDLKTQCLTMMSMKMWYLLLLAAFLPIVPTVAEVVKSVSDCDQFLFEAKPPRVPGILEGGKILNQTRYKVICQTYKDERKFLTLYDTEYKIPVFSALKYTGAKHKETSDIPWKIEPQLENGKDKNMCDVDQDKTYTNQAGDKDYRNNKRFDRGQLIRSSHGSQISDKNSTFTLTNIVPQAKSFNQKSWKRIEKRAKHVVDDYCTDNNGVTEAYVVTGAIPNDNNNKLNNRVNIPSKLWSAFCCYSPKVKILITMAYWADNSPETKYVPTNTLAELKQELGIDVFPETKCPVS
ncbi:endonuclease domain-containing 1 protein-like isoform X1 [Micropterus salmoides]|uniref:endonuclease domain-containing 1 protein-like isoform X1 n=2 Tax=Micropterus salmoides TaxID=27706 RepID=UPI0018ED25A3|nr:endonuclease domain-containing 1 protein-like isoform X1 [Micropterus salmoides]XP_038588255.1 endonuclease domain-containing 1 protein-like isoform X1 [Micropterus salmoides]